VAALIVVIITLLVLGVSLVAWNSQHGPGRPTALKPGPDNQQPIDPAQAPQIPGQADILIGPDPGFIVLSRTEGQAPPPPPATGAEGLVTTPTGFGLITQNLTGFCRLTGKRVADCTCTRCKAIQKKGKAL